MSPSTGSFDLSVSLGHDSFSASGKPDLVLGAFEDFKALTGRGNDATSVAAPRQRRAGSGKHTATGINPSGDMTLPAFLARLKMKGGAQTGTAILAWSAQYGDKDKLTPTEVQNLWKQTKYKVPSTLGNVTRDLNKAVKEGLLRKNGKGKDQVFYADTYEQEQVAKWATPGEA